MYAAHCKLDNLIAVVDDNHMQAMGDSRAINALDPLKDKWEAFGWEVVESDGHKMPELLAAFQKLKEIN